MPVGWAIAVIVLWVAVICLAVVVLGVLRQVNARLDPDNQAAWRTSPGEQGPAIGSSLPRFEGRSADGRTFTGADMAGRPGILLFLTARCAPCLDLAKQLRETDTGVLGTELVVVTAAEDAGDLSLPGGLRVVAEASRELSDAFGVNAVPFGIAVDKHGIVRAKQLVQQVSHLAGLAFAAAMTLDADGRPTLPLEPAERAD